MSTQHDSSPFLASLPSWLPSALVTIALAIGGAWIGVQGSQFDLKARLAAVEHKQDERKAEHDKFLTKDLFEVHWKDVEETKELTKENNRLILELLRAQQSAR